MVGEYTPVSGGSANRSEASAEAFCPSSSTNRSDVPAAAAGQAWPSGCLRVELHLLRRCVPAASARAGFIRRTWVPRGRVSARYGLADLNARPRHPPMPRHPRNPRLRLCYVYAPSFTRRMADCQLVAEWHAVKRLSAVRSLRPWHSLCGRARLGGRSWWSLPQARPERLPPCPRSAPAPLFRGRALAAPPGTPAAPTCSGALAARLRSAGIAFAAVAVCRVFGVRVPSRGCR